MGYSCTHIFEISSKWIFLHIRWQKDNLQRKTKFRENMMPWQPQKLGKVYFLKSENVTKFPQKNSFWKKKKKIRQWQKPNKSNRMLCLHKTAIKKSEILQYESRHHRIHCSFYFFILSLLFILFFFFKPNTYALPSQLHFTHHHFRCWSDDELWPLNMRPHVDCILREGRKAYMCITLRGKCVNICVNMRHTRDMGGTA